MTYAIPVIDLENVQLDAVRAGAEELGAVQVINHGVPGELSADQWRPDPDDEAPAHAISAHGAVGRK